MSLDRFIMRKEFDKLLCLRYPEIFADRHADPRVSGMGWGFCCGDFWFELIERLCANISVQVAEGISPPVVACQVKEKFGRLRFHVRGGNMETRRLIEETADQSERICDTCGSLKVNGPFSQDILCRNCKKGICDE